MFRRHRWRWMASAAAAMTLASALTACVHGGKPAATDPRKAIATPDRLDAIRRARVWTPTDVSAMDLRQGPDVPGAVPPGTLLPCRYVDKRLTGRSPKFTCDVADHDEVKVKYGRDNGEVYAEVAATRLLWALGFGADAMFPVRVECRGCPRHFQGPPQPDAPAVIVEPASIERKMDGWTIETSAGSGWSWDELDRVDPSVGGASRAERDALKLLAVFIQHTDSKPEQQRLLCLAPRSAADPGVCAQPFMMLNDVGQTFGHANRLNRDRPGSVSFEGWSRTAIWSNPAGCVANMTRSFTGTLDHPVISEAGRKFLADLLAGLSDSQLHDLFEVARFSLRSHHGTDEWVDAFKHKRDEIVHHVCPNATLPSSAHARGRM